MDHVLKKYCPRIEFDSYEDFRDNFRIEVPEAFNFGYDVVDEWARVEPDKRALLWCNDAGEERTFTFTDLSLLSNQAANAFKKLGIGKGDVVMCILRRRWEYWVVAAALCNFTFTDLSLLSNQAANAFKKLGIGKGDVVMCILRRRWEYWVVAAALCKLGATIIPASLQLTKKDIAYRANSADVKMLVCVNDSYVCTQAEEALPDSPTVENLVIVAGQREGWLAFDQLISAESTDWQRPEGEEAVTSKDIMLIYFTSGTTGNPKAVCHNFAHPLGHIITAKYWQQVRENRLHMSVTDSGWAKFGWGKIYGQWIAGATIFAYDMDKFVPSKLLQKIQDYRLTTFCAPPTMYRFMLQEDVAAYDLSSVENFATAGEPLNAEVTIQWEKLTGKKIREGFGQTEGPVLLATFPWIEPRPGSMGKPSPLLNVKLLDDKLTGKKIREGFGQTEGPVLLATFPWIEPRPGSMGKPSPLLNVKLLDDSGVEVEDGEEGAICVTGLKEAYPPGLFVGYFHDEEKTRESVGGEYYNLHDMAWRDSDGYCFFVGRNDDVIKCSGYRIGPFEVESALVEHPAVVECAVTAAPDPIRGKVVKATIVLAKGYEPSDELTRELQNHVKKTTAPYKYPRIVEYVDELPKTIGGKIKRKLIRTQDGVVD